MKTPREILLERHQTADPKLDLIRTDVLNREVRAAVVPETLPADAVGLPWQWLTVIRREILLPLRWHLAGLSAAWLVVALLNLDSSAVPSAGIARKNSPSPQQILAALRENRRQISELTEPPVQAGEAVPAPRTFVPKRRSERESTCAMA